MDVSVIIINYNTFDLTLDAVRSIETYTKDVSYEIILIDNASTQKKTDFIDKLPHSVKYIESDINLGTSKAFNKALTLCSGKYILWLNPDVLLIDNFIFKLYSYMEDNQQCGICGGNVLGFDYSPAHSYRKKLPNSRTVRHDKSIFFGFFRKVFKRLLSNQYNYTNKVKKVGYITGADMMIRKSVIDQVGAFDEDIFMYAEETEFTYRVVSKTNYTVDSIPWAKILHLEGASFKDNKSSFSERRFIMKETGFIKYLNKCYGEDEVMRYFKVLKEYLNKFRLINIILRRSSKVKELNIMIKLVDNLKIEFLKK